MKTASKVALVVFLFLGLTAVSSRARVDSSQDHAWMGVTTESVDYDMAERSDLPVEYGALIADVVPDSPAEKAGLKENDIIVAVNGAKITDSDDLSDAVDKAHPGDKVDVKVYRDGKEMTLSMKLGSTSDFDEEAEVTPRHRGYAYWFGKEAKQSYIGVDLTPMTGQLREYFGVPNDEGVLVSSVQKDSPADHAGLKAGDVITEINGRRVTSSGEIQSIVRDSKAGEQVNLAIIRDRSQMQFPVEVGQRDLGDALAQAYVQALPKLPAVPLGPNMRKHLYLFGDSSGVNELNSKDFQKQMDELREQLKSLRKEVFDSEQFKEQMRQLKDQLKSLDLTVRDLEKKVEH
jgi:C-terminal processing protease CtpA/Prc